MPWIIGISAFILINLIVLVIFSWRNAKAAVKPKVLSLEREEEYNKKRGLWLDFDSYNREKYVVEGKGGYILHAELVDNGSVKGTGKYVIICHGHTANRYGSVKYANCFIKLGFSCIIYDARTHGENAPDKCTLGAIEAEDLLCVIEDTRKRFSDVKELGLHGESMGSSTSLIVTKYSPPIDFIVADCGFTGVYDVIHDCYGNIHLAFLTPFVRLGAKILYGVDIKETNALRDVKRNKYPVLFIHGTGDTFIRPSHSEKLCKAASENGAYTELILVEDAGHAKCRAVAGFETYTGYIESFLKRINLL